MTPQEKANELVAKMEKNFQYFASREIAIQHALIAVDEIINVWINSFKELKEDETMEIKHSLNEMMELSHSMKYWNKVKQEIQKL